MCPGKAGGLVTCRDGAEQTGPEQKGYDSGMMSVRNLALVLTIFLLSPLGEAAAQSPDAAAERSRLGDARIRAEAERQEQEELARQQQLAAAEARAPSLAEPSTAPTPTNVTAAPVAMTPAPTPDTAVPAVGTATVATSTATAPPATAAPSPATPEPAPAAGQGTGDISQALEQLRELGELRDAGYVTDEEFEQIKERILSGF